MIYYKKLDKDPRDHKIFTNVGLLFNCMVLDKYAPIKIASDFFVIKDKLRNGLFQRDSQLESKQIDLMDVMITRWKERYIKYHSQTNEEMPSQPQSQRTPNRHSDDAEEDSEVKSHCKKTNKNDQWYADGWYLLVKLRRQMHNNKITKNEGYGSIGLLLNCLTRNVTVNPIKYKIN